VVHFFIFVLFAVTPMAVGQYRESSCPMVTSSGFWGVAMDMPHRVMPSVLLQCGCMAKKWATMEVHLIVIDNFAINLTADN
jgi:hypothetical protein